LVSLAFLSPCHRALLVRSIFSFAFSSPGKTLQCIALLQTLLKQSPRSGKGTIEKAIIVCPSSLVKNWGNELGPSILFLIGSQPSTMLTVRFGFPTLVKWLGDGVINPLSVDGKGGKETLIPNVRRWVAAHGRNVTQQGVFPTFLLARPVVESVPIPSPLSPWAVMIVSYETLRSLHDELANCEVGLLLADEGHRLKNSGASSACFLALRHDLADPSFSSVAENLTFTTLTSIKVRRRVILTGTPIQVRSFALLSFARPTQRWLTCSRSSFFSSPAERLDRILCPSRLRQPRSPRNSNPVPKELRE
jgi:DNA repair and recombination RAD54-like protein